MKKRSGDVVLRPLLRRARSDARKSVFRISLPQVFSSANSCGRSCSRCRRSNRFIPASTLLPIERRRSPDLATLATPHFGDQMRPTVISRLPAHLPERRAGWRVDWVWGAFVVAVLLLIAAGIFMSVEVSAQQSVHRLVGAPSRLDLRGLPGRYFLIRKSSFFFPVSR